MILAVSGTVLVAAGVEHPVQAGLDAPEGAPGLGQARGGRVSKAREAARAGDTPPTLPARLRGAAPPAQNGGGRHDPLTFLSDHSRGTGFNCADRRPRERCGQGQAIRLTPCRCRDRTTRPGPSPHDRGGPTVASHSVATAGVRPPDTDCPRRRVSRSVSRRPVPGPSPGRRQGAVWTRDTSRLVILAGRRTAIGAWRSER